MVLGYDRPAVAKLLYMAFAGIDHGFDGEGHAGFQFEAGMGFAVVQNLGVVVVNTADAVAAVFAHHRVAAAFGQRLDGMTDIAKMGAGAHLFNAGLQAVVGGLDQTPGLDRGLTHEVHAAGIAMEVVFDEGDVDVDDIAVGEPFVAGDAMAHHLIDRGAHRFGETPIADIGGNGVLALDDMLIADPVEFVRGDAGAHVLSDDIQHFRGQASRDAHFLDVICTFDGDWHEGSSSVHLFIPYYCIRHGIQAIINSSKSTHVPAHVAGCPARGLPHGARGGPTRTETIVMATISMRSMLEAGVHFGHQTRFWNPKMAPYIFGHRNKIHIINLESTVPLLGEAENFLAKLSARGGRVLFVGTKRAARDVIPREAERCGMPYVSQRWLGGTLTNYATVRRSVKRLLELEAMAEDGTMDLLIKKETVKMHRELGKLEKSLGGIRSMESLPDALFVIDVGYEKIAVAEANKLGIPVVALVDTNNSPDGIDYVIPANDDAISAVTLFATAIAGAILSGRETLPIIEGDTDEFVEEEEVRKLTERRPQTGRAKPAPKAKVDSGTAARRVDSGKARIKIEKTIEVAATGVITAQEPQAAEAKAEEKTEGTPAVKKTVTPKTSVGKVTAEKSTIKKTTTKKTTVKKATTKKTVTKKAVAKKTDEVAAPGEE